MLQYVTVVGMLSMLDGLFGYNQVLVHKDDQQKTVSQLLGECLSI